MVLFLSFMNLWRNLRRTLAILLTVALGTGVLFTFKGFIHGVLNQYKDSTIHAHYGHGQINTKNYRESAFAEPWNHWIDNFNPIKNYLIQQPQVEYLFPRVTLPALIQTNGQAVSGVGQGVDAKQESLFFHGLRIISGVSLTNQEDGILLGAGLAKALGAHAGEKVTVIATAVDGSVSKGQFNVTGISETGSLDYDNRMFRIQLQAAQKLLKTTKVESIALGLKNDDGWKSFADKFEKEFPQLEATSFAVLDKVYYQHSVDWLHAQFKVIQLIILSIVLLGIFNSVSASVLERKQEIGNFRANGESVWDVMRLITLEGIFLGFLGGVIGISCTYLLMVTTLNNGILMPPGPGLTRPFYISFEFEWQMVYTSLGLSVIAALVASLLAGIRVAKMPIAKALRAI